MPNCGTAAEADTRGRMNVTLKAEVAAQIYAAMKQLGAPPELLAIIGSYGDTLPDSEILALLKGYNAGSGQHPVDDEDLLIGYGLMVQFATSEGFPIAKSTLNKRCSPAINTGPKIIGYFGQRPATTKGFMRAWLRAELRPKQLARCVAAPGAAPTAGTAAPKPE